METNYPTIPYNDIENVHHEWQVYWKTYCDQGFTSFTSETAATRHHEDLVAVDIPSTIVKIECRRTVVRIYSNVQDQSK